MNDQQQDSFIYSQRQDYQAHSQQVSHSRSWWYSPLVGYPLAVVFVAGASLIPLAEKSLGIQDAFIEPPFVIALMLIAWLWGIGPALLALLLEVLALDYWLIPPLGSISFFLWPNLASFVPFILIQLISLALVVKQKHYRQQLLLAHQAATASTENLATSNQALVESNQRLEASNQALARSNAQLDEANHVKDLFLSLASHELKTPITSIQGQAQLALRRLARQRHPLPARFAFLLTHLEKVEEQTSRLCLLVNDLLNLSSLRSGKMPLRVAPCDFRALCREIVEDQTAITGHSINLTLPPHPLILQADGIRLGQVVLNLLTNAFKYSPEHSTVEMKVQQRDMEAILTIHNDGPTIPLERQHHLFEPFYRTPESQISSIQGWGLGLAISKEIVRQHQGDIQVTSAEEKGTTFSLILPLQPVFKQEQLTAS